MREQRIHTKNVHSGTCSVLNKEGQTPLVCCFQQRKTSTKDRRYATSQVKRAPLNGTIRFFAHTSELKHFGDNRGVIHPGQGRRGSCHHRDLVEQAHQTVLEAVV
jgi:hypothetical protein